MYFKSKTKNLSLIINKAGEQTNLSYNEALLNIKNVKIAGGEEFFYKRYSGNLKDFQGKTSRLLFYNTVPPYITEPFIIILLLILLSIISIQNISNIASLIASYALIVSAVFRLAPTISRIQVNLADVANCYDSVRFLPIPRFLRQEVSNTRQRPERDLSVSLTRHIPSNPC